MNDKVHLLLIDDEKNYLLVLETLLTEAGYAVTALNDPETALAFLEESEVDIVITDMKMPRISGREVLERVKKNWPHIPVLIMTAFGSIESAVEAMRYGAFNYITKPFSNDELLLSIQNAAELARAHRQYQLLRESLEERYGKHQIIGRSRAIRDMLALVDRAGPRHGAHHRRIRHRQGTRRARHPLFLAAQPGTFCFRELHGPEPRRA